MLFYKQCILVSDLKRILSEIIRIRSYLFVLYLASSTALTKLFSSCVKQSSKSIEQTAKLTSISETCAVLRDREVVNSVVIFTYNDFSTNVDIQYGAFVCGFFTETNTVVFGAKLNPSFHDLTLLIFTVTKNIVGGFPITVTGGSISFGKKPKSLKNNSGLEHLLNGNRKIRLESAKLGARIEVDPILASFCNETTNEHRNNRSRMIAKRKNNEVTMPNGQSGTAVFEVSEVDNHTNAYFNVPDGNKLFNNVKIHSIDIQFITQSKLNLITINVGGTKTDIGCANFVKNFKILDNQNRVIFNFYEAESIVLNREFSGSIEAPFAKVISNAVINGRVSFGSFHANAVVNPTFTDFSGCN